MKKHEKQDLIIVAILSLLAGFIWLRDTSWISTADDTLPILIAIPVFIWMGSPWQFQENPPPISKQWIIAAIVLFMLGMALNLTVLLTLSWTSLLWAWLASRTNKERHPALLKLLVLPIMAFPWITLDITQLGWWFRLSGAWIAAHTYALVGLPVTQEGTQITVNNIPMSIEAACAGMNNLQSMLISGSVVNYLYLGQTNRYWWNLALLVVIAWFANIMRIMVITCTALVVSPEFAMGTFHTFGGWIVLMIMFGMSWWIFSLQEPKRTPPAK